MTDKEIKRKELSQSAKMRLLILPILLVSSLVSLIWALLQSGDWTGFALNFGTEMAGALITFVLIDLLIARVLR